MRTILASRPGFIQASVRATLDSFPQVALIDSASGCLSALIKVKEQLPALLVIDNNLSVEEVGILLCMVKEERPKMRCMVLVDTFTERQKLRDAGADVVLMRDSFGGHFMEAMGELGVTSAENVV